MKNITKISCSLLLLLSVKLSAQIVYTDVDPDSTVSASLSEVIESYSIDLNNDGTYEFVLRHFNPDMIHASVELVQNPGSIQQVITDAGIHAKVLAISDTIAAASTVWGLDQSGILNAPWYGGGDKYFGFRFKISGQWHYGWARVLIPSDHLSFTIKDYAYNQTPNASIIAGQTNTSGVDTPFMDENNVISVYPNPFSFSTTIKFPSSINNIEMNLYNLKGQKIKTINHISGDKLTIDRGKLNSGIYFYELKQNNKNIANGKLIIAD